MHLFFKKKIQIESESQLNGDISIMGCFPTEDQLRWHDYEMGMFVHFSINTFNNKEWSDGTLDPMSFNPSALDAEQWVKVGKDLGAKYMILTAKHHDGFCLWPTKTTEYSVKKSPYKSGAGDIVKEFTEACRKHQMGAGLYLSPWDRHEPKYKDKDAYDTFYAEQLTELTSQYGDLVEIWFDGAGSTGRVYDWDRFMKICHKNQPHAMIFSMGDATIRWCGNERGYAKYPNWNAVSDEEFKASKWDKEQVQGNGTRWLPAECDVPIRLGWFYHTYNQRTLKSLKHLMKIYHESVGYGAGLLLNITPDRRGLMPEKDAKRAKQIGDEIRRIYSHPIKSVASRGYTIDVNLESEMKIDRVMIQEDLTFGERIREYHVETFHNGTWKTIASGSSVGHKKIDVFKAIKVNRVLLVIQNAVDEPIIRNFAIFSS
jgi:alpha-L-fucosidase